MIKNITSKITPIKVFKNRILVLNQTLLPHKIQWETCFTYKEIKIAIQKMYIRGAPAIGILAAFGFYLGWKELYGKNRKQFSTWQAKMYKIKQDLDSARPTAVNLEWATTQMYELFITLLNKEDIHKMEQILFKKANEILQKDKELCLEISYQAAMYILKNKKIKKYNILTHCNTGALATGGIGTALGLIRYLHHLDKVSCVYVDETRPYLQGARLTTFELQKEKIPYYLITDSSAGFLMQKKEIDFIIVGADRINQHGDVANKIGTYSLAVLALHHKIPFYVIAPSTTVDNSLKTANDMIIEERSPQEVRCIQGVKIAPKNARVKNYSFDITPNKYISKIFC